jgi:UDPglucose 6-dehydrogenase
LATGCDALVLVTEWTEFREIDFSNLAPLMNRQLIVDGRNYLDQNQIENSTFDYHGIGKLH